MDRGEQHTQVLWPHGSIEERWQGLPVRLRDPGGALVWRCEWKRNQLCSAEFRTPDGEAIAVRAGPPHPIFGASSEVARRGDVLARFSEASFARPGRIPAMDSPARLPPGGGTAILNFLAARARATGLPSLRYVGPYPTASLFDALLDCFRVLEDAREGLRRFTADAETRAVEARMREVDVDFEPAPFERRWPGKGVCSQLREGVEKVFVGGRAFSVRGGGARRLRRRSDGYVALVEIAGEPYGEVAEIDALGGLVSGPHPLLPIQSPLLGQALPSEVGRALADALPSRAPRLLGDPLREVLAETPLVWGDPGADEAAFSEGRFVIHPAFADRLEGNELLAAIARAVEGKAQVLAQKRLAERLAADAGGRRS